MKTLAELYAIRDRVLQEFRDNPPRGPLLVEHVPAPLAETCRSGHTAWVTQGKRRACAVCTRLSRARKLVEAADRAREGRDDE